MPNSAQGRAISSYRARLADQGIVRFELKATEADRHLLRTIARRLMKEGPETEELRRSVRRIVDEQEPRRGRILAALMDSPLAGSDLDLSRIFNPGRKINL